MKFDSPLFDRIRVKPDAGPRAQARRAVLRLEGCGNTATHRAPKGRLRENEYWRFCLDHVREYNHSYNYFAGMSDDAVIASTRRTPSPAIARPGRWAPAARQAGAGDFGPQARAGPVQHVPRVRRGGANWRANARAPSRAHGAQRRAQGAARARPRGGRRQAEIKARFKVLVKRHHPDANGGDRALRGQAARDHPGLQLSEIDRARCSALEPPARPGSAITPPQRFPAPCRARAARRSRRSASRTTPSSARAERVGELADRPRQPDQHAERRRLELALDDQRRQRQQVAGRQAEHRAGREQQRRRRCVCGIASSARGLAQQRPAR